jgi:predicted membrane-bound mannosyltransferase
MTVVYSAIPYKTPWCMLGFLHGMILLAGVGAAAMIKLTPNVLARTAVILLLAASGAHLAWQAYLANYVYYADSRNPYVYAHPTTEVFTVVQRVQEIAKVHPDGHALHIQVICPGDDYWPLPWYLRFFTSVEYGNNVDANTPAAPVIIASPSLEEVIAKKLYEQTPVQQRQMYMYIFDKPYYVWLRPKVKLIGLVRKDLWQLWQGGQRTEDRGQRTEDRLLTSVF